MAGRSAAIDNMIVVRGYCYVRSMSIVEMSESCVVPYRRDSVFQKQSEILPSIDQPQRIEFP